MRRAPAALLLAASLAAGACESPTIPARAEAYDFRTQPRGLSGRLVVRWPAASTIRVFLTPTADPERDRALESAFARAADAWNRAVLYGEYRLVRAASIDRADVAIGWTDAPAPVDTRDCRPDLTGRAVTTFCNRADPSRLDRFPLLPPAGPGAGDVRMLVTLRATEAADPERVHRLVAHELGHVIGIANHSPSPADLMTGGVIGTAVPSPADRGTAQILYHTRPDITP